MSPSRLLRALLRRLPFLGQRPHYRIWWLTPSLAVSRAPDRRDWRRITEAGITAVVDLQAETEGAAQLARARGIAYLRLPIPEHNAPTEDELLQATDWICKHLKLERRVLVHCRAGIGRSPLVACAALVQQGLALDAAFAALKQGRPHANLTPPQQALLHAFAQRHTGAATGSGEDA